MKRKRRLQNVYRPKGYRRKAFREGLDSTPVDGSHARSEGGEGDANGPVQAEANGPVQAEANATAGKTPSVPFKTRDEQPIAAHGYFWSEEQLGSRGRGSESRPWLWGVLGFMAIGSLVGALAWHFQLAPVNDAVLAPTMDPDTAFPDTLKEDSLAEPRFDSAWDEAHREQREMARDALWQLLLAPDFTTRQPCVLPSEDAAALREYDTLYPPVEPDSVSIEPMVGWQERDGERFAFLVKTSANPGGFVAEVHSKKGRNGVRWKRFVQHHHRTFLKFLDEKPESPQVFYVTVRLAADMAADGNEPARFDRYEVSGTNPNVWFAAALDTRNLPAVDEVRESVVQGEHLLRLEFSWADRGGENPMLLISALVGVGWD